MSEYNIPEPVTTEKREPKLYSVWCQPNNPDRYVETGEYRAPKDGEWFIASGGQALQSTVDFPEGQKKFILTKYTPEASQSAQKGPMEPKQVTKPIKETIAAKALREAMDKVKEAQEREAGIRQIVDLEAKKRENREQAKAIDDQITTLSKKWLKGVGK